MPSESVALDEWLMPLVIDHVKLQSLTYQLSSTYKDLALNSTEQFLGTPVTRLPTGHEKGTFLAFDFGGSNLRIAFIDLLGPGLDDAHRPEKPEIHDSQNPHAHTSQPVRYRKYHDRSWPIGDHLKVEKAEDLFGWLGDCLAEVITAYCKAAVLAGIDISDEIPLGITFSFPMIQTTLARATLMPMGKGFTITSNPDLGNMVLAGYLRYTKPGKYPNKDHGLNALPKVRVVAITNDAVATLLSLTYSTRSLPRCKAVVGLIMGTGCNAAAPMSLDHLHPSKHPVIPRGYNSDQIVVNTEWTIRGVAPPLKALSLITRWDEMLDRALQTPGFQPFEYLVAGFYLGEVVRLVVLDYFTNNLKIKEETLPAILLQRNALTTEFVSRVVATAHDVSTLVPKLNSDSALGENENWRWTVELVDVVWQTAKAVSYRSAVMIAAAIVGLIASSGELDIGRDIVEAARKKNHANGLLVSAKQLIVAYTGGLITQYPGYKDQVQRSIDQLIKDLVPKHNDVQVLLHEVFDGGLVGAAALASTEWPLPK